jgi:alanine dehydrogenase
MAQDSFAWEAWARFLPEGACWQGDLATLLQGAGAMVLKTGGYIMRIGCPKEIKPQEFRVGLTPHAAREVVARGHEVVVERGAGVGAGFADEAYTAVGARIADTAEEVFATADLVIKVKEPQAVERKRLREGQVLFTYLHLAPDPEQARS